jgi:cytochrome c biogenesis protein CcmG/thiol:disulfide interchange protein DsbE
MKEENQSVRRVNFQSIILIVLAIVGVGIIVLLQSKNSSFNPSGKPLLGKGVPAPNFTFPSLDGKKVNLADYKGKVVLLNIWATGVPLVWQRCRLWKSCIKN